MPRINNANVDAAAYHQASKTRLRNRATNNTNRVYHRGYKYSVYKCLHGILWTLSTEQGEDRKALAYENMSLLWVSLSRLGGAAAIHEQVQVKV